MVVHIGATWQYGCTMAMSESAIRGSDTACFQITLDGIVTFTDVRCMVDKEIQICLYRNTLL